MGCRWGDLCGCQDERSCPSGDAALPPGHERALAFGRASDEWEMASHDVAGLSDDAKAAMLLMAARFAQRALEALPALPAWTGYRSALAVRAVQLALIAGANRAARVVGEQVIADVTLHEWVRRMASDAVAKVSARQVMAPHLDEYFAAQRAYIEERAN